MNFIRILISIAFNQVWSLLQLDAKNAFLHRDLGEEVHINLPLGFQISTGKGVSSQKSSLQPQAIT